MVSFVKFSSAAPRNGLSRKVGQDQGLAKRVDQHAWERPAAPTGVVGNTGFPHVRGVHVPLVEPLHERDAPDCGYSGLYEKGIFRSNTVGLVQ